MSELAPECSKAVALMGSTIVMSQCSGIYASECLEYILYVYSLLVKMEVIH